MTVSDIYNYVLLTEQRLETKIKSHSRNWLIAACIAFVLFIVLVVVIFRNKPTNEAYENQIRTLDSLIHYQQTTIDALQKVNQGQDSMLQNLDEAYKKNRPTETRIIHSYERIPFDINSLNREELRKSVTNY